MFNCRSLPIIALSTSLFVLAALSNVEGACGGTPVASVHIPKGMRAVSIRLPLSPALRSGSHVDLLVGDKKLLEDVELIKLEGRVATLIVSPEDAQKIVKTSAPINLSPHQAD